MLPPIVTGTIAGHSRIRSCKLAAEEPAATLHPEHAVEVVAVVVVDLIQQLVVVLVGPRRTDEYAQGCR